MHGTQDWSAQIQPLLQLAAVWQLPPTQLPPTQMLFGP
jgi:hypothetical protein